MSTLAHDPAKKEKKPSRSPWPSFSHGKAGRNQGGRRKSFTCRLEVAEEIAGKVPRVVLVGPAVLAEEGDGRVLDPAVRPPAARPRADGAALPVAARFFVLRRLVMAQGLQGELKERFPLKVAGQHVPSMTRALLLAETSPKVQGHHDAVQKGTRLCRPVLLQDAEAKFLSESQMKH